MTKLQTLARIGTYEIGISDTGFVYLEHDGVRVDADSPYKALSLVKDVTIRQQLAKMLYGIQDA